MNDKMQLQRMAFEEAGMGGTWGNLTGNVPVTEKGVVFLLLPMLILTSLDSERSGLRRVIFRAQARWLEVCQCRRCLGMNLRSLGRQSISNLSIRHCQRQAFSERFKPLISDVQL
jgi:hypothetical protein